MLPGPAQPECASGDVHAGVVDDLVAVVDDDFFQFGVVALDVDAAHEAAQFVQRYVVGVFLPEPGAVVDEVGEDGVVVRCVADRAGLVLLQQHRQFLDGTVGQDVFRFGGEH